MAAEWGAISDMVQKHLSEINSDFTSAIKLVTDVDPFNPAISIGAVDTAIRGVALSLVSLFFVLQFCNEAMYLKIKSYEDVFKIIFKFFLAKALVDNASGLMKIIYNAFTGLVVSLSGSTSSIMSGFDVSSVATKPASGGFLGLNYVLAYISALGTMLIVRGACWVISLILIGRLFEVIVYTTVAPIPLATVAGEGWSESSKNFIKGYAAVCLQSLIIVVMFNAFNGISAICSAGSNKLTMAVTALSLAMGVAKSGQWARTAVGMG